MLDRRNAPVNVYLSAGSNIAPEHHLRMACQAVEAIYGELTLSSVYCNPTVGFKGNDFLNMVIGFSTHETPEQIVANFEQLHQRAGRRRQANPFCSRTLDLDLLLYDDVVMNEPGVQIPRDEILHRAFVLWPLAEIAPELKHPQQNESYAELWQAFDKSREILKPVLFTFSL